MRLCFKSAVIGTSLVGLALVGCNQPVPEAETTVPEVETTAPDMETPGLLATFQCPDGEIVEADFTNPDEVVVTLPDQEPITLPRVESGSGAKYSDGTTTFWNKGESAMVEVDGETVLAECTAQ